MWFNRHKTLTTAILIFLGSFLLFFVAVIPIYRNASTLQKKIATRSKELDSLTEKVAILSQLDPAVLEERVKVLDSALPPKKDILLYLNSIEGLSRELNLTFGGLSLTPGEITEASGSASAKTAKKPTKGNAGPESLDTEIKIKGGQDSIYAFLRTVEEVLPLMQIKDIKVSVIAGDQFTLSLTLGMLWAEPVTTNVKGPVTLFGAEEDKYFALLSTYRTFGAVNITPTDVIQGKTDLFAPYTIPTVNIIEPATIETTPSSTSTGSAEIN